MNVWVSSGILSNVVSSNNFTSELTWLLSLVFPLCSALSRCSLSFHSDVTLSGLVRRDRTASCAALLSAVCQGSSIFPGLNYLNQSHDMFFNNHKLGTMVQSIPQISSKCYRNLRRKTRWNHFLLFRGCSRLGRGKKQFYIWNLFFIVICRNTLHL